MTQINRDEWLAALAEAQQIPTDDGALTVREFGELFGCGKDAARRKLEVLVKAGKARKVTKVFLDATGNRQRSSAYKLEKPDGQ